MGNIDINSKIYTRINYNGSNSGQETRGSRTSGGAKIAAENAARSTANSISMQWHSGIEYSYYDSIMGSGYYGNKIIEIGTPSTPIFDTFNQLWYSTCEWSVSQSGWLQQVHLKFNVNGLSINNIQSATLTINNASGGIGKTYYVCAPKDSTINIADDSYYHPNNTNLDKNNKQFFVEGFPCQIDITNQLKQCINIGNGVLIITSDLKAPNYENEMIFSNNSFSLNYEEAISACTPPNSISNTGLAYITANGNITLNLGEGGGAGINNPITGYRIYWKSGEIPYIGGAEGFYDYYGTDTTISFNEATKGSFPSIRGNTYYFKVCTRGSYAVNNAFLSPISDAYVSIVYNQLPNAPNVQVDKSRIKSTGSTEINFTVTPGSGSDVGQTRSVWYSTTPTTVNVTRIENNQLSQNLNTATTFYFWTYDGYEFSDNYTEKNIRINTPPNITSVTMSTNQTFLPNVRDGYVKNINGTAQISKDSSASLTYQWKLQYVSGVNTIINNSSPTINISNMASLTNIDVTLYSINFDMAYRLVLIVTDDIGENATGYSSQIFGIPAAPTITFYNQHNNSNVDNTTLGHFDTDVRFKYNINNTGINAIELWNGDTKIKELTNKNNNEDFVNTTLDELTRGTSYNLKLKFICNSISTFANFLQPDSSLDDHISIYRAADITPTNIVITRQKDNSIKPYTHDFFYINFGGYISGDVSSNLQNIYTIKLNGENMAYDQMTASGSNISAQVLLKNAKTTAEWKTLLGLNNAPNAIYTLQLTITATNLFGKTFTSNPANPTYVSLDFIENLTNEGSTIISIKNTNGGFTGIPSSYDSEDHRYPLFETQTIKLTISGIQCYADQSADIEFYQETVKLGTIKINSNNWISSATAQDPYNHFYTLNLGTDPQENIIDYIEFEYTIPKITSDLDVNYWVKVILANNQYNSYDTNLDICKYCKFNESEINFKIASIDKEHNQLYWECTNLGSNNLSSKICQFYTVNILSNNFDDYDHLENCFGNSFSINDSTTPVSGTIPTYDIVYFGAKLTLTSEFQPLVDNITPFGEPEHIIKLTNLYTLYNQVPNLLYGKNFFLLNGTSIGSNSDGMLYLHTTGSRTKIYFGNSDQAEFEITQNGLIIDGGTWDI